MEKIWRKCDRTIHKGIRISFDFYETNKKLLVKVQPKKACKLEFADHLWLQLPDQYQLDIVVL